MNLADLLPWISTGITLCALVGGFFAMRQGYSKQASEIQDKVIAAYKMQNETQERQIQTCEKEIARLKRVVATIQVALKRRGLKIEIDNDAITLIDDQSMRARTVQIKLTDEVDDKKAPDEQEDA